MLRQAELNLLTAQLKVEAIRNQIQKLRKAISEIDQNPANSSWTLIAGDEHLQFCMAQIEAKQHELQGALEQYEKAKQACSEVQKEVEALHQLRKDQMDRYRAEANHLRQIQIDDVVMQRWTANQNSSSP